MTAAGRRLATALFAGVALFAMHGLTASTASAATPCGEAPVHAHAAAMPQAPADAAGRPAMLNAPMADPTHGGMLCLALLVWATALLLVRGRRTGLASTLLRPPSLLVRSSMSRGPPGTDLDLLCVCRN